MKTSGRHRGQRRTPAWELLSVLLFAWLWLAIAAPAFGQATAQAGAATNSAPATNAAAAAANATTEAPTQTNAAPAATAPPQVFTVQGYQVVGNTLLPDEALQAIFSKHIGTNVSLIDILAAARELQTEYGTRGYATVAVTLPQQTLANGIVTIRVFEARLAEITIANAGGQYFSSNNVMRALPGLSTNMILNSRVFQEELDRANANRDRQIYPVLSRGVETNTTDLLLRVEDQLPLHGKMELNNQSAQATPENRLNSSLAYNNLWQAEHSVGLQYSFSPEKFKTGDQWNFYDVPLIANYSAFYRLPLAGIENVTSEVESRPESFGYNEATRRFELPAATGRRELNAYTSRSTIDTGATYGIPQRLFTAANRTIDQQSVHQDLTINEAIGARLTQPLREMRRIRSALSLGFDYKIYQISSFTTNNFIFTEHLIDSSGNPFTRVTVTPSTVPASSQKLAYFPLSFRWDGSREDEDKRSRTDFGFSYSPNVWYSGDRTNVQAVAGSTQATGIWHILGGSLSRDQLIAGDPANGEWRLFVRADGQWASEPLISNEQFGIGGVNGVRGYREGEVFGSSGWRITAEQKTPPHRIGYIGTGTTRALNVRASVFMDYGEVYAYDTPPGVASRTPLWGTGIGGVASVGSTWEAHLMFAWPLLTTLTSEAGQVRVSFALNAQF